MSQSISPDTGQRYGLERVCRVRECPRSTIYASNVVPLHPVRRGPKPKISDTDLLAAIRADLADHRALHDCVIHDLALQSPAALAAFEAQARWGYFSSAASVNAGLVHGRLGGKSFHAPPLREAPLSGACDR